MRSQRGRGVHLIPGISTLEPMISVSTQHKRQLSRFTIVSVSIWEEELKTPCLPRMHCRRLGSSPHCEINAVAWDHPQKDKRE